MRFLIFFFLLTTLILSTIYAHGGHADDDDDDVGSTDDSSHHDGVIAQGNIGLAFGLTALAAGACVIGSLLPFADVLIPRLIPRYKHFTLTKSPGFLSGSIAFSGGVLLFLSLCDLFPEAHDSFVKSKKINPKHASLLVVSVMVGMVILMLFTKLAFLKRKRHHQPIVNHSLSKEGALKEDAQAGGQVLPSPRDGCLCQSGCCSTGEPCRCNVFVPGNVPLPTGECACLPTTQSVEKNPKESGCCNTKASYSPVPANLEVGGEGVTTKRMRQLSWQIAIALAIHNFPEGVATFSTTVASSRVGILFGIALALHKFPEGLMIALPIFYSTGSRLRAFFIAATVGVISQFAGAVLAYLLFVTYWNDLVSAILFSAVVGVLLYTIIHGIFPLARSYDPTDKYVTNWALVGFLFFALVASLFDESGTDA